MNQIKNSLGPILLLVGLLCALVVFSSTELKAEEALQRKIHATIEARTKSFCDKVLPSWFASRGGVDDPTVRAMVTDCYIGQARLGVMGGESMLAGIALSEVPAALLANESGMKLDPFGPLAGRSLWSEGRN
jgi:hypothetical protein